MPKFSDAPPQETADAAQPRSGKRGPYVRKDDIKQAVKGREADVARALGIAWHGGDHINCPYPDHLDRDPSWRLMEDGNAVCTCRSAHSIFDVVIALEGGDFESAKLRVAQLLHRDDLIIDQDEPDEGVTVAQIAEAKLLPVEWLRGTLGWTDLSNRGKYHNRPPAVGIPYHDKDGNRWFRIRLSLRGGKKRFVWKKGDRGAPLYGAHWIDALKGVPYVFLVEGESDCATLWFNGIPALGLPGADGWNEERHASLLDDATVIFVPIEPDKGGERIMAWLPRSRIASRVRVIHMAPAAKDVSALYIQDPATFAHRLGVLMEASEPVKLPEKPAEGGNDEKGDVTIDDFYAYMPERKALFVPKRELWPLRSIDDLIPPLSKEMTASEWITKHRPVHGMTWLPGEGVVIDGKVMVEGGWVYRESFRCFNRYLKPRIRLGDPKRAERWVKHTRLLYPGDAEHIFNWLAHRVQRPGDKINHILVLGGAGGIGKDSILDPVKYAVGDSNFQDVPASVICGAQFNGYSASVILRISEARDFGEGNRFQFYEHLKIYGASPPDVIRVNEKNIKEYYVKNLVGIVITTNHKTDGMYLPREDRRHYVAWSEVPKPEKEPTDESPLCEQYFDDFHDWLQHGGGNEDVAAFLMALDLSQFNPKAPPKQTDAFLDIAEANQPQEESELLDALDRLNSPEAVTVRRIAAAANDGLAFWLRDRKNRRLIPGKLERCGYVRVPNPDSPSDGRWILPNWDEPPHAERHTVYAPKALSAPKRYEAVQVLVAFGEAKP